MALIRLSTSPALVMIKLSNIRFIMSASASTWGVSFITVTANTHCLSSSIMAVMWLPKRTSTLSMSSAFAAWLSRRTRRVSQFNTRNNSFPRFVNGGFYFFCPKEFGYLNFNWEERGKDYAADLTILVLRVDGTLFPSMIISTCLCLSIISAMKLQGPTSEDTMT